MTSANVELHKLNTGRTPRVITACRQLAQHLFYYQVPKSSIISKFNFFFQGHVSAGLILGGVDPAGSHVIQIHPHGSTAKLPYTTMGSGSLAAMSILEDGWKPDLNSDQARQLKRRLATTKCTQTVLVSSSQYGDSISQNARKRQSVNALSIFLMRLLGGRRDP